MCVSLSSALSPTGFSAPCIELCWEGGEHFRLLPQSDVSGDERLLRGCKEGHKHGKGSLWSLPSIRLRIPSLHARALTPTTTNAYT